jgi:hypothetical protein
MQSDQLILKVAHDYLGEDKSREMFLKMDDIAQKSGEEHMIHFFARMRLLVDPPMPPPPMYLWAAFYSLVVAHMALVIAMIIAFFILPFYTAWYIALPLMAFIQFFALTRVECKLTQLENFLRQKLGMKRIGGFVGHYVVRPASRLPAVVYDMKMPSLPRPRMPKLLPWKK